MVAVADSSQLPCIPTCLGSMPAEGSFDTCLLLFVLHHIADSVQTTLREAARVAKRVPWGELRNIAGVKPG